MWAMAVTVDVASTTADDQRDGLHRDVLPNVRRQPGFRHGTWALREDARAGIGFVVFGTEQDARASAAQLQVGGPAGSGATVASVHVYEVLATADAQELAGG